MTARELAADCVKGTDELRLLRDRALHDTPAEHVPIEALGSSYSPRVEGEDKEYMGILAESEAPLPPILVHRPSMKVIDGMHRLGAARLQGRQHIEARFFEGAERDAFLLAVVLNVTHGLPLSTADRTAAVERILSSHPQWSDRAVAVVAGLSPSRVSEIRRSKAG